MYEKTYIFYKIDIVKFRVYPLRLTKLFNSEFSEYNPERQILEGQGGNFFKKKKKPALKTQSKYSTNVIFDKALNLKS